MIMTIRLMINQNTNQPQCRCGRSLTQLLYLRWATRQIFGWFLNYVISFVVLPWTVYLCFCFSDFDFSSTFSSSFYFSYSSNFCSSYSSSSGIDRKYLNLLAPHIQSSNPISHLTCILLTPQRTQQKLFLYPNSSSKFLPHFLATFSCPDTIS